jgi:uncharacterized protein (DUF2141 family)
VGKWIVFTILISSTLMLAQGTLSQGKLHTLTVQVEGVNSQGGNVGVLIFNSTKGWPEDVHSALKDVVVPAHVGVVTVKIENLPSGTYAVAVGHDVNLNHKVDKNFLGVPKEQWGMSNNPHALVKPPSFTTAQFELKGDAEIRVRMQ